MLATKRERNKNKTQERQIMHNTIVHHLLTNIQSKPEQQLSPPVNSTHLCTGHGILWYGNPCVEFGSAVLAMILSGCLYTCSLAKLGKLESPWFRAIISQQHLKHQCVINIILILNANPTVLHQLLGKRKIISAARIAERTFSPTVTPSDAVEGVSKSTTTSCQNGCFNFLNNITCYWFSSTKMLPGYWDRGTLLWVSAWLVISFTCSMTCVHTSLLTKKGLNLLLLILYFSF